MDVGHPAGELHMQRRLVPLRPLGAADGKAGVESAQRIGQGAAHPIGEFGGHPGIRQSLESELQPAPELGAGPQLGPFCQCLGPPAGCRLIEFRAGSFDLQGRQVVIDRQIVHRHHLPRPRPLLPLSDRLRCVAGEPGGQRRVGVGVGIGGRPEPEELTQHPLGGILEHLRGIAELLAIRRRLPGEGPGKRRAAQIERQLQFVEPAGDLARRGQCGQPEQAKGVVVVQRRRDRSQQREPRFPRRRQNGRTGISVHGGDGVRGHRQPRVTSRPRRPQSLWFPGRH